MQDIVKNEFCQSAEWSGGAIHFGPTPRTPYFSFKNVTIRAPRL